MDFNLPTINSLYTDFLANMKDRDLAIAQGLDPAVVTANNPQNGFIRWRSANLYWEKYDAGNSSWAPLAASYAINITGTVNKVSFTAPANAATINISNNKVFAVAANLTLSGTDGKTITFGNTMQFNGVDGAVYTLPAASGNLSARDLAESFSNTKTFSDGMLVLAGASNGTAQIKAAAGANAALVFTLPAANGTLAILEKEGQLVSGGATITSKSLSTGNITVDCGARALQYVTNGGNFTITAPAADGSCILLVTNNASAGAISFTGFSVGSGTGDSLTTTNGHKFSLSIWRVNAVSGYRIAAHQ